MGLLRLTDEGLKFVYRCVWNEIVENIDEPLDLSTRHKIYMALKNSNMKVVNELVLQCLSQLWYEKENIPLSNVDV